MTLDALFGDLRAALHTPSQGSWARVLRLFREGAEVSPEVVEGTWAPYARDLLERSWPDRLRRPPPDWFDDPFLAGLSLGAPIRPSEWPGGERVELDVDRLPELESDAEFITGVDTQPRHVVVHPSEPIALLVHEPQVVPRPGIWWSTWDVSTPKLLMRGSGLGGLGFAGDGRRSEVIFFLDGHRFAATSTRRTPRSRIRVIGVRNGIEYDSHEGLGEHDLGVLDANEVDAHDPEVLLAHARGDVWFETPPGAQSTILHPHGDKLVFIEPGSGTTRGGRTVLRHGHTSRDLLELPFDAPNDIMRELTVSPDGRHIAMCTGIEGGCVVYCAKTGSEVYTAHTNFSRWHFSTLCFARNGALLLITFQMHTYPGSTAYVVVDGRSREVLGKVVRQHEELSMGQLDLARFTHDSSAILLPSAMGVTRHPLPSPKSSP